MPRPTAWPIVIALAITLVALGAATSIAFCCVGAALLVLSLVGWISQLLPGRGHEHEPLAPASERAKPVVPRTGAVEQLKPGVTGHRFQLPEKVHPISAGIKGGIIGGLLMPIPAVAWGFWTGHGPWFPINLLAGMVLPGLDQGSTAQIIQHLEKFHPGAFVGALILHAVMSVGFGLVGGVLLPTLPPIPGGPFVFGGIILPLAWSGANYEMMGIVNPILNQYIDWPLYVVSQLIYGVATTTVIVRSEQIFIAPRGEGPDGGGPSIPTGWLGCIAILCVLLSGCSDDLPGKPTQADQYVMPQHILSFHDLYSQRCAGCHGADGNRGPGPPLNNPLYVSLVTENDLRQVIAAGRSGTLMPAWSQSSGGPLTDAQVDALVKGIKTNWAAKDPSSLPQNAPPLVPPSPSTSATAASPSAPGPTGNAVAGTKIFAAACADCHGKDGTGGDAGSINNSAFLELVSDQELRRYIITGRSDLPDTMPNFAESTGRNRNFQPLTAQQVNDLVALLAHWRSEAKSSFKTAGDCPNVESAAEQNGTVPLAQAVFEVAPNHAKPR